jgi:Do/DeqQ family serine protease
MKRNMIFSGLIALIVSLSSYGALNYFEKDDKSIKIEHINKVPSQKAVFSLDSDGKPVPLDFNETATNVLDGVVHIKSTQLFPKSNARANYHFRSIPEPFKDFFGDSFGRQYYFPNNNKKGNQKSPAKVGSGSGVIISEDGYIITNNHVIDNSDDIEITLHDNRTYKAIVVGADPSTDLALLKIKQDGLPTVPFMNSDNVKIGQWVMAVGNPMGLNSTVTAGIISAKGRNINILKDKYAVENFIQTDAAINPGNSGGALVNLEGGLVGINTAIASPTGSFSGYGFAIPANIVQKVITDLMEYGTVQRGVLGVMIKTVDSKLSEDKSLDVIKGVYVDSLMDKSAAAKAGIKVGDVILKVNEVEVASSSELQGAIAQYRPGETVDILLHRDGKEKSYKVKLNNRDGDTEELSKEAGKLLKILGAKMENVPDKMKQDLSIKSGVLVDKILPGKIRKQTQMRDGFIITHVDKKAVKDMADFLKKVEDKEGGHMLEGVYKDIPGQYYYAIGL